MSDVMSSFYHRCEWLADHPEYEGQLSELEQERVREILEERQKQRRAELLERALERLIREEDLRELAEND